MQHDFIYSARSNFKVQGIYTYILAFVGLMARPREEQYHVKWSKVYDQPPFGKWYLVKVIEHADWIEEIWDRWYDETNVPKTIFISLDDSVEEPPSKRQKLEERVSDEAGAK